MILSLTGFMGSGKTTVGRIVADALGCPYFDLDDIIVKKAGKTIPSIFADDGESAFRSLEASCLQSFIKKYAESTVVLSLGGGTLGNPASASLVHDKTLCIYLRASEDTLRERLKGTEASRPLLKGTSPVMTDDGLSMLLSSRIHTYESVSAITLDTDGLTPDQIADEIIIDCR